jgi:uncharacterized protein DUF2568
VRAANLALKFLLELAAFAAFAYWGASTGNGVVSVVLAVGAPLVFIVLWARFAAPRSARRLPLHPRMVFELGVFALAAVALVVAGEPVPAAVFTALVVVNAALLTVFDQWEA